MNGDSSGNGNVLIVDDWKLSGERSGRLARTRRMAGIWCAANGTYGEQGAYALPKGFDTQPYTVQCGSSPVSVTDGFPCEQVTPARE